MLCQLLEGARYFHGYYLGRCPPQPVPAPCQVCRAAWSPAWLQLPRMPAWQEAAPLYLQLVTRGSRLGSRGCTQQKADVPKERQSTAQLEGGMMGGVMNALLFNDCFYYQRCLQDQGEINFHFLQSTFLLSVSVCGNSWGKTSLKITMQTGIS